MIFAIRLKDFFDETEEERHWDIRVSYRGLIGREVQWLLRRFRRILRADYPRLVVTHFESETGCAWEPDRSVSKIVRIRCVKRFQV